MMALIYKFKKKKKSTIDGFVWMYSEYRMLTGYSRAGLSKTRK